MIIPEDGLVFATDLEAWQAWLASRNRVRQLKTAVRERVSTPAPVDIVVALRGQPRALAVLEAASPSHLDAYERPALMLDEVAIAFPRALSDRYEGGNWQLVDWAQAADSQLLAKVERVLAPGHYLGVSAEVYAWARARDIEFLVEQHGLLTPFMAPLAAGARALVWSQADGEFWASSRSDVSWQVVGSQLLFNAALQPRIKVCATARPLFLGQLHGAEIGRSYMAQVSERFCHDTGAIYRPHPSEKDKASRLIHAYWRRRGIEFDPGTSPLFETNRPVVSVFSTGTLEAAARGIPAWVYAPNAPSWVHAFHSRYGLSRWSDIPTVAPQSPALEPATAIAQILAA